MIFEHVINIQAKAKDAAEKQIEAVKKKDATLDDHLELLRSGKVHRWSISRGRPFFFSFFCNFRMVLSVYSCCDFVCCTLHHIFFLPKFTSFVSDKN